jgi:hypothetical protein
MSFSFDCPIRERACGRLTVPQANYRLATTAERFVARVMVEMGDLAVIIHSAVPKSPKEGSYGTIPFILPHLKEIQQFYQIVHLRFRIELLWAGVSYDQSCKLAIPRTNLCELLGSWIGDVFIKMVK